MRNLTSLATNDRREGYRVIGEALPGYGPLLDYVVVRSQHWVYIQYLTHSFDRRQDEGGMFWLGMMGVRGHGRGADGCAVTCLLGWWWVVIISFLTLSTNMIQGSM